MKLYRGPEAGIRLLGEPLVLNGNTEVLLHPALFETPGAIANGLVLHADLIRQEDRQLCFVPQRRPDDDRALVFVDQPLLIDGAVDYVYVQVQRRPVRVIGLHSSVRYYHAIALLEDGTGVHFRERVARPPRFARLRRLLGGSPRGVIKTCSARLFYENGLMRLDAGK